MLTITKEAADKLTQAISQEDLSDKSLRVFVNGFG